MTTNGETEGPSKKCIGKIVWYFDDDSFDIWFCDLAKNYNFQL
jgi:hypothetical protein